MRKGTIKSDFIPRNKARLDVPGLNPIKFTSITGLEDELQVVDLPDKTRRSGGHRGPSEMVCMHPMHHQIEEVQLELWFTQSQDPVVPGYSRPAAITYMSESGNVLRIFTLIGVFPKKRKTADYEGENEGEMAQTEWTFNIDDIRPVL